MFSHSIFDGTGLFRAPIKWWFVALATLLLLALSFSVHAQEWPTYTLGEPVPSPVPVIACDEPSQASAIYNAYVTESRSAAIMQAQVYQQLPGNGGTACIAAYGMFVPLRVIHATMVETDGKSVPIAVFTIEGVHAKEVYAFTEGALFAESRGF